ncbi:MAG: hypothetical protein HY453_01610 [Parcubacteria group bacterium]|nr:hypothetical protein [Parcubacteria group bacterium]
MQKRIAMIFFINSAYPEFSSLFQELQSDIDAGKISISFEYFNNQKHLAYASTAKQNQGDIVINIHCMMHFAQRYSLDNRIDWGFMEDYLILMLLHEFYHVRQHPTLQYDEIMAESDVRIWECSFLIPVFVKYGRDKVAAIRAKQLELYNEICKNPNHPDWVKYIREECISKE